MDLKNDTTYDLHICIKMTKCVMRMSCAHCDRDGDIVEMSCGCRFHVDCLFKRVSNWQIPCPVCGEHLSTAYEQNNTWHLGIETNDKVIGMFQIDSSSRIQRRLTYFQKSPDLKKCCLKNNICVS